MTERFSASRASRHMQCHASANLPLAIEGWEDPVEDPNKDNAANHGSHIHEVFAQAMEFNAKDLKKFSEAITYIANLRSSRRFNVLIEDPTVAGWLPSAPTTTADLVLYLQDEIHIVDLKAGRIPQPAVDNKQLLFYAATYGHLAPKAKGVYLHIVQPWADLMEVWFADVATIAAFMTEAINTDSAITNGSTDFNPGDGCMFCPANPHGRGLKGKPSCPVMLHLLYPPLMNEDEILGG